MLEMWGFLMDLNWGQLLSNDMIVVVKQCIVVFLF